MKGVPSSPTIRNVSCPATLPPPTHPPIPPNEFPVVPLTHPVLLPQAANNQHPAARTIARAGLIHFLLMTSLRGRREVKPRVDAIARAKSLRVEADWARCRAGRGERSCHQWNSGWRADRTAILSALHEVGNRFVRRRAEGELARGLASGKPDRALADHYWK